MNTEAAAARKDASDAITDAANTRERAGELEKGAATLRKEAEDERMARVKIEANEAWRHLSKIQQQEIGNSLRRFGKQDVVLAYNRGDGEGRSFADDIAPALEIATWRVNPIVLGENAILGGFAPNDTGVVVRYGGNQADAGDAANAIVHELSMRGFDAVMGKNPAPGFWIQVQSRPHGPQGVAKPRAKKKKP